MSSAQEYGYIIRAGPEREEAEGGEGAGGGMNDMMMMMRGIFY
jgi:hypothetical protein